MPEDKIQRRSFFKRLTGVGIGLLGVSTGLSAQPPSSSPSSTDFPVKVKRAPRSVAQSNTLK